MSQQQSLSSTVVCALSRRAPLLRAEWRVADRGGDRPPASSRHGTDGALSRRPVIGRPGSGAGVAGRAPGRGGAGAGEECAGPLLTHTPADPAPLSTQRNLFLLHRVFLWGCHPVNDSLLDWMPLFINMHGLPCEVLMKVLFVTRCLFSTAVWRDCLEHGYCLFKRTIQVSFRVIYSFYSCTQIL